MESSQTTPMRHVRAMEARQREERRSRTGIGRQAEAFVIEGREFVELAAEEDQPSSAVVTEPDPQAALVVALDRGSASTIVSELISSTNALTEVYGMSKISCGTGRCPDRRGTCARRPA